MHQKQSDVPDEPALASPAGFVYEPRFLGPEDHDALVDRVRALEYKHDVFRGQRLKRSYAQFGYAYVSTGRRLDPASPMPDFLLELIARAEPYAPEGAEFDQCIVTCYPAGAGIGWHTDAPRFGECVMAVSLGGEARLQFRPNGSQEVSSEVLAAPGSLYVLRGPARWDYQHQVVPVASTRYSLTFRKAQDPGAKRDR